MTTPVANALSTSENNGKWIGDGGAGEMQQDGFSLTLTSASRGTPTHARYNASPSGGDWFFEVILIHVYEDSSVSVGIVTPDECKEGWKTRGMFYNGNLTNGSAALLLGFGPYLKEGDTVGVHVANNNTKVTFFYNGRCLGTGFDLKDEGKVYCPCLHVSGTVQISFAVPEHLPASSLEAEKEVTEGIEGEWRLIEAFNEEGVLMAFPLEQPLVLNIRPSMHEGEGVYDLCMTVANTLRTRLAVMEGDKVKIGLIMSTMMMPPPELREIEAFLSSSLPKVQALNLSDDTLVLSGDAKLKLTYERYHKVFEPLDHYHH